MTHNEIAKEFGAERITPKHLRNKREVILFEFAIYFQNNVTLWSRVACVALAGNLVQFVASFWI